jgi:hypothetical protein
MEAMARWLALGLVITCTGCDAILGLGQFTFDGSTDATDECVGPNGCWACTPTTNDQFLNACSGQCVSFDTTRITPFLQPDGALPMLPPPPDASTPDVTEASVTDTGATE